ncbi:acyl-CoA carboxylase epsilon subunit [Streptomyces apricus]|uniref:Acyl-CoA carboxylase subunit epsilon n=1 Tax=Streptomyces apricus TaxID=1828112 RepID=A0A5A9ZYI8_9ACTN|nr:acyl-CoA carboxylase epsilon subunit [Streptomyces apricus]KAA0922384.1 acyl-CoA carboxylase subunit epsilon [Streptomyces apricus]
MTMLRVEKGEAGPEEVAAITAVLLARAAARTPAAAARRGHHPGRRWRAPAFGAPHSWRT